MIPADADEEVLTSEEIARKYKVDLSKVAYWSDAEGFPEGWPSGPGRTLVRVASEVDDWLRTNLPVFWAQGQESDNPYGLEEGKPKDLVSLERIAEFEAKALGRDEPIPMATLRGYRSKKSMPEADRNPGDGLRPEVMRPMWFRQTAYDWVNRPRKSMRRQKKAGARAEAPAPVERRPREQASGPVASTRVDVDGIAARYAITLPTARRWTETENFPLTDGTDYDAAAVDAWVWSERRRAWEAAQRRSATSAGGSVGAEGATAGAEREPPAAGAAGELTLKEIGPRYGVPVPTGEAWSRVEAKGEDGRIVRRPFPDPLRTRPRVWDQHEVDDWVREARPHVWASFMGTGPVLLNPLPEGDPRDLLDVDDFAEIWGIATRGAPLEPGTVSAYHNRGQIPYADRTPDDGLSPRVLSYHWYRETVYDVISSRRGKGNKRPRA
ncbi:hypothetical protein [Streptomyces sp. NPDC047525]|uniref:hypothetical protein n=1 Tax=Streptomyces sp. NPDC047525 TaxID=3155264 RepID=UPI00340EC2F1